MGHPQGLLHHPDTDLDHRRAERHRRPVSSHSELFCASLPSSLPKAYLELTGASHFAPSSPDTTIAQHSIAWLKRFVDDDSRYSQFLCPALAARGTISESGSSCPC